MGKSTKLDSEKINITTNNKIGEHVVSMTSGPNRLRVGWDNSMSYGGDNMLATGGRVTGYDILTI